jgi:hypothetical protein
VLLVATATSGLAAGAAAEVPAGPARYAVSNETARTLEMEAPDGTLLVLYPLRERVVSEDELTRFGLSRWPHLISVREIHAASSQQGQRDALFMAVGLGVWFTIPWAIFAAFVGAPTWWKLGWVGLGSALLLAWVIDWIRSRRRQERAGTKQKLLIEARAGAAQALKWFGQQFYLSLSLLIGIVLPGAAIFFAADGLTLYRELRDAGVAHHPYVLTVIGRVMQLVFVASAALVPALLYFLFDREHLETLRTRFIRQVMRFDPTVPTRPAVLAKYDKLMAEAYGRSGRILPGRRSPILLASLVVAFGWTFTLLHGDVTVIDERGITALFEPRLSAVTFAFLGAYFFGINSILRGYVRRDLRPKTYSTLTVRVIVVVVLAWVVELEWKSTTLFVLVFLFGIVPDTALVLLKESVRGLGRRFTELGEEQDPLTRLEGIDLYDRARLFEEGVTNVESLAHHDVVDLMLQTRIPAPRLVDWLDQAILYLHAGPASPAGASTGRVVSLRTLREYGIRTATDLENALQGTDGDDRKAILAILGPASGVPHLELIAKTIADDEWMENLRAWRRTENAIPEPRRLPEPGAAREAVAPA